jgi:hypothetical protein
VSPGDRALIETIPALSSFPVPSGVPKPGGVGAAAVCQVVQPSAVAAVAWLAACLPADAATALAVLVSSTAAAAVAASAVVRARMRLSLI